jgi:hypothetical protein
MRSTRERKLPLTLHPSEICDAVRMLRASATRHPDGLLTLRYTLEGDPSGIRIPAARPAGRADGLWQHTCFEAFVAPEGGSSYLELNFSPSGEWALYRFTSYREGREAHGDKHEEKHGPEAPEEPAVAFTRSEQGLTLEATASLECLRGNRPAKVALAAVIEESSGRLSHWALEHPPGKPDFHHRHGFALQI